MKKTLRNLEDHFNYIESDEYYLGAKDRIEIIGRDLIDKVHQFYYKERKYGALKQKLGYMKSYYNNCSEKTMKKYFYAIIKAIGNGDTDRGEDIYYNTLDKEVDLFYKTHKEYDRDNILYAFNIVILYESYSGFWFESKLKMILCDMLEHRGYSIIEDRVLDDKYKIDILIQKEDIRIGLQLKSITYRHLYSRDKDRFGDKAKHYKAIQKAIDNNIVDDVVYILHKDHIVMAEIEEVFDCAFYYVYNYDTITKESINKYSKNYPKYEKADLDELMKDIEYVFDRIQKKKLTDIGVSVSR